MQPDPDPANIVQHSRIILPGSRISGTQPHAAKAFILKEYAFECISLAQDWDVFECVRQQKKDWALQLDK